MSETMPDAEWIADPAGDIGGEEFEPAAVADPEEPESLVDEGGVPPGPDEANEVDVAEQQEPVDVDDDGYDREE